MNCLSFGPTVFGPSTSSAVPVSLPWLSLWTTATTVANDSQRRQWRFRRPRKPLTPLLTHGRQQRAYWAINASHSGGTGSTQSAQPHNNCCVPSTLCWVVDAHRLVKLAVASIFTSFPMVRWPWFVRRACLVLASSLLSVRQSRIHCLSICVTQLLAWPVSTWPDKFIPVCSTVASSLWAH